MASKSSINKNDYKKTPLLNNQDEDDGGVSSAPEPNSNQDQERCVLPFPESDEFSKLANQTACFPPNLIVTTRYTVLTFFPKSLFEQFRRLANVYFLVLGCIAAIGVATEYYDTAVEPAGLLIPLTIVVLISVGKDGVEDAKRNKADNRTNCRSTRVVHCDGSVHDIEWKDIEVGSVLLLLNDDEVPADAVILDCGGIQGASTYVETAAIDGETNLKLRLPGVPQCATGTNDSHSLVYDKSRNVVSGIDNVKTMLHVEAPNGSIHNFNGSMECEYYSTPNEGNPVRSEITLCEKHLCLRGSVIRASEWVVCVVVYTGRDTKLSRNSKSPPSKLSVIDSVVNRTLAIAIGSMILICCLSALFAMYWEEHNSEADYLCLHEGDMDTRYPAGGCENGATSSTFLILTFATLYNNFVAISMYVSLEMVYLWQAYFISQDLSIYDAESDSPAEAHTSGMCADLGQVKYVLSDKTGTLTKNVMKLRRCSVAGMLYGAPASMDNSDGETGQSLDGKSSNQSKASFSDSLFTADANGVWSPLSSLSRFRFLPPSDDNLILSNFMRNLAVCNNVMLMPNQTTGKMEVTDRESLMHCLEAESPDEVALVLGAAKADVVLVKRDGDCAVVSGAGLHSNSEMIKVLAINEFDSKRKRMSIVVRIAVPQQPDSDGSSLEVDAVDREVEWGPPTLLCKGADSTMFSICKKSTYFELCKVHVDEFACNGLRTLVMAQKELSEEDFADWHERYKVGAKSLANRKEMLQRCAEEIEVGLNLLGAVGIEDELQDGVPQCIDLISKAGVNIWMITGDKPETAVAIGRMCGLLRPQHELEMLVKVSGGEVLRKRLADLLNFFENKRAMFAITEGSSSIWGALTSPNKCKFRFFSWNNFRDRLRSGHTDLDDNCDASAPTSHFDPKRESSMSFGRLSYAAGKSSEVDARGTCSSDEHSYLPHESKTGKKVYTKHALTTEIALVIDGATLEDIWADQKALDMFRLLVRDMSTVIACRVSPLQKASLVRMIKTGEGKPVTLAIGDGANDIGMINEAKVGVGICGKEGRHAANSADFAIGQFRFLSTLMLKHGRYNYIRCSKLVLYCFFKNLVLVSSLFYYCIYSGFSGTMPLDSIIFSGFNFYLGLPILCIGIFDIDVPFEVVLKYPFLAYATGRRRELLNMSTMLRWCSLAFVEGLVLFALVVRVVGGSTQPRTRESDGHSLQGVGLNDGDGKAGGIYSEGFLLYCCVIVAMVYKVSAMTCLWNAFHVWSHVLSMAGFLFFVYVYSKIEAIFDWYNVTEFTLALPTYWLALLMVPVCICIMDNFVEWFFAQLFPTSQNKLECIAQEVECRKGRTISCDSSDSAFAVDERKSTKSIKLAPTSSDVESDFAY